MDQDRNHISGVTRREWMGRLGMAAAAAFAGTGSSGKPLLAGTPMTQIKLSGRLNQAVCRWCYNRIPIEEFAREAAAIGLKGIDLIGPADWPVVKKYGLLPTMVTGAGTIPDALNRRDLHDKLEKEFQENIPRAAQEGIPNVITFSGNRRGMSDGEGLENCVVILDRVKGLAERHGVTICLELLNSKVDHKDYMADHTAWGVELMKRVNSPRVKLLYDIYHMQIMEGDVIRTIRQNHPWIGHFHTGGNPGRHEIDQTQELNYRPIVQAIAELGFKGYIAHEFVPLRDPLTSLREAVLLCDVS